MHYSLPKLRICQVFLKSFRSPTYAALIVVLTCQALPLHAAPQIETQSLFEQGLRYYKQSDYTEARSLFERLVRLAPGVSGYYHWLGKCYGRLAEKSGWIDAISFSKKTLKALKKAVELDNENIPALKDLMTYYREAPVFLGGSSKKAQIIAERLQKLQDEGIPESVTEVSGNVN